MKRMFASGSEPRYLPVMENTSCWGLVLLFCASAPEAVLTIRTRAMAVLVNMVVSCGRVRSHLFGVRLHLLRLSALGESPGCIATFGTRAPGRCEKCPSNKGFRLLHAGRAGGFGHGIEVLASATKWLWPSLLRRLKKLRRLLHDRLRRRIGPREQPLDLGGVERLDLELQLLSFRNELRILHGEIEGAPQRGDALGWHARRRRHRPARLLSDQDQGEHFFLRRIAHEIERR